MLTDFESSVLAVLLAAAIWCFPFLGLFCLLPHLSLVSLCMHSFSSALSSTSFHYCFQLCTINSVYFKKYRIQQCRRKALESLKQCFVLCILLCSKYLCLKASALFIFCQGYFSSLLNTVTVDYCSY